MSQMEESHKDSNNNKALGKTSPPFQKGNQYESTKSFSLRGSQVEVLSERKSLDRKARSPSKKTQSEMEVHHFNALRFLATTLKAKAEKR